MVSIQKKTEIKGSKLKEIITIFFTEKGTNNQFVTNAIKNVMKL
jgi:hypothetical protein